MGATEIQPGPATNGRPGRRGEKQSRSYGAAYGLAPLGCTLPVFLGVVGTSLQLHGLTDAVWQFVLFGIGVGTVLAM